MTEKCCSLAVGDHFRDENITLNGKERLEKEVEYVSFVCVCISYLVIRVGGHLEGEDGSRGEADSEGHGDFEGVDGH